MELASVAMASLVTDAALAQATNLSATLSACHESMAPVRLGSHTFEATTSIGIQKLF